MARSPIAKPAAQPPALPGRKIGAPARFAVDDLAQAIRAQNGIVSLAAKQLGVTRKALYDRIQAEPELQAVLQEARETVLDFAEGHLLAKIKSGDLGAICFLLKCQGKARGWIERPESEIHLHQNMQINQAIQAEKEKKLTPARERALDMAKHFRELAEAAAKDAALTQGEAAHSQALPLGSGEANKGD